MKKKIVVFSSHRHFESGGVGTHLSVLQSELVKQGEDFTMILGLSIKQLLKIKLANFFCRLAFKSTSIVSQNFYILELSERLKSCLNKLNEYDEVTIHVHDKFTAIATYLCKDSFSFSVKIVQTLHAPFTDQYRTSVKPEADLINYSELLDIGMTMKLDNIIAVDSLQKEISNNLLKVNNQRLVCIPNAVNIDFLDNVVFSEIDGVSFKHYFVIARHLHSKNGVVYAVEALIYVLKNIDYFKNFKVLILGEGAERDSIQKMIDEHGLKNKILLLGSKPNEDTVRLIKGAYLSIIPSVPMGNYIEATSLTMLESMYLETPVLASNIGGLAEVIDDKRNGFLAKPRDVNSIITQIEFISKNKDVYESVKRNAKETILSGYSSGVWFRQIKDNY